MFSRRKYELCLLFCCFCCISALAGLLTWFSGFGLRLDGDWALDKADIAVTSWCRQECELVDAGPAGREGFWEFQYHSRDKGVMTVYVEPGGKVDVLGQER